MDAQRALGGAAVATVTIERLVAGGDGVARLPDGMAVFVPRTAPGDVVEVDVVSRHRRYARGRVRRLVTSGPARVAPPCRHYDADRCGGCQFQHLAPAAQHEAKQSFVTDALRRIGGRPDATVSLVPSAEAWRYRTKVALAARDGAVGFHRFDAPDEVFALEDCRIAGEPLMRLWDAVRAAGLPADITAVVLREDRDGGLHALVEGTREPWVPEHGLTEVAGRPVSWWWRPPKGAARVVRGPRGGFPALAFEQTNRPLAERIRLAAVESLGVVSGEVVWDLYGGTGDTARLLADRGAAVWSVDQDRSAIAWAESVPVGGGGEGPRPRYMAGRVEEVLHRLPQPAAVVVNPPRTGLHRRVSAHLANWGGARPGAARLSYVSCDPATLARDVARLSAFGIRSVTAYDLFPQTAHVEVLAVLEAA